MEKEEKSKLAKNAINSALDQSMKFIGEELDQYSKVHSSPEDPILNEIYRDTNLHVLKPNMLSGHLQGHLLKMISHMMRPKRILELGTFTGYSAICLAAGLQKGGRLVTIDSNIEISHVAEKYFKKAGLEDKIDFVIGNALEELPKIDGPFDLVFIDADKINYLNYYKMIIDQVVEGGIILADNVLWSGKILNEEKDEDTQALDDFNKFVVADQRVENVLLPLRDGIMMLRKLPN